MRPIAKNSTDQSVVLRIIDATDGTPEEAVEHNTSGISLWYRREGGSVTAITPAALAAANSAHADGGIEHLDDGYYRLDLPDAAVATGANGVTVGGTVTGMVVIGCYVPLFNFDPYNGTNGGLSAFTGITNETDKIPTILADTAELQADWADGGRLDLILDARASQSSVDTVDGIVDDILTDTGTTLPATLAGLSTHSAADVWAVATRVLTAATNITGGIADAVWEEALADHSGTSGSVAEALGAAGSAGDPWTTALPGSYTAGQAGYIVWTNLDAAVSTRSTLSSAQVNAECDQALADYDAPTNTEMVARTLASGSYATAATQTSQGGTLIGIVNETDKIPTILTNLAAVWTTALTESYAADGAAPTPAQLLFMLLSVVAEFSISGTTITCKKLDGSTTAMTFTLDDATNPTSRARAS